MTNAGRTHAAAARSWKRGLVSPELRAARRRFDAARQSIRDSAGMPAADADFDAALREYKAARAALDAANDVAAATMNRSTP